MSTALEIDKRLPVVAKPTALAIGEVSVLYDKITSIYSIKCVVSAVGLKGNKATFFLMHAEDKPLVKDGIVSGVGVINAEITLPEHNADYTIEVPDVSVPNALVNPKPRFYLLLISGKLSTVTLGFDFATPPPPSDFPKTKDDVGKIFVTSKVKKNVPGFVYEGHKGQKTKNQKQASKSLKMRAYARWDYLITNKLATEMERIAISAMADSEGAFDSINAWDDQILSLGVMQKTFVRNQKLNIGGGGELVAQLNVFKQTNLALYERFLGQYGWSMTPTGALYTDPVTKKTYSGQALFDKVREGITALDITSKKRKENDLLAPFVLLGQNEIFQDLQVKDYLTRLRQALAKHPTDADHKTGHPYRASDCFQSAFGMALVLDQSVNRPACVAPFIGEALKQFFVKNPTANTDPRQWQPSERLDYESQLIIIYGPLRDKPLPNFNSTPKKPKPNYPAMYTGGGSRYTELMNTFKAMGYKL
jgi:hypothetical protein